MSAQPSTPNTAPDMVNIEIDGQKLQVPKNSMIIAAADKAGIPIPRFCYHDKLPIAANCRMCMVETEMGGKPMPKPQPACATPVMEGMKVYTQSQRALSAQRNVMEFLLINHPLDCPICDQGGECDLQDQAMGYGVDTSRFAENKRAVEDKYLGALVKTSMNRCIQCTRCVRFSAEVCGAPEMGATGAKTGRIAGKRIGAIAGDLTAVEEMFALKELLAKCGSANLAVQGGDAFDAKAGRASYIFNPTIAGIDQADALLIIGSNPRKEAAGLNARIRKRWGSGQLKIGVIGAKADLTYDYDYLGAGTDSLTDLAAGKNAFADVLKNAKHPIVLVGAGAFGRHDGAAVLALAAKLAADFGALKDGWNGFAVLQDTASRAGALDIGFAAGAGGLSPAQTTTLGTLDPAFLLGVAGDQAPRAA